MPIYEYHCEKCGIEVEIIAKLDDPPPLCSKAGCVMVKKISLSSFELKGTGWYKTDFKEKK